MKILQINKFFYIKGGSERYFFDLSELLEKKGHEVIIWSSRHPDNFKWQNKNFIDFYDFSKSEGLRKDIKKAFRIFWNFEANKKLEQIIKKEKPDVAHLHNWHHHFSPSIVQILKKRHIPITMTLHDYKMFCPNHNLYTQNKICVDCLKRKYRHCVYKKCVKNSYLKSLICFLEAKWQGWLKTADKIDYYIAPSLYMKRQAIKWGISEKKIINLPYFLFKKEKNEKFMPAKPGVRKPYFLYFGRLSREKGVDILIKAFDRANKKNHAWRLKIAGAGEERDKLENIIGVDYRYIDFLGKKSKKEIIDLIRKAYLVIAPSLWPENFPYVIMESFQEEKAVIGSNVGGIPEMIIDKETGLLFKPGSVDDLTKKIDYVINNRHLVLEMNERATDKIARISDSDRHYRRLMEIYQKISNE